MTANEAIRNYRAILLGRLNNTKNEIEYYKKNLKYLDEHPGKFKNEKLIRDLINMSPKQRFEVLSNRSSFSDEQNAVIDQFINITRKGLSA